MGKWHLNTARRLEDNVEGNIKYMGCEKVSRAGPTPQLTHCCYLVLLCVLNFDSVNIYR